MQQVLLFDNLPEEGSCTVQYPASFAPWLLLSAGSSPTVNVFQNVLREPKVYAMM